MTIKFPVFDIVKIAENIWQLLSSSRQSDRISKLVEIIENYYLNSIIGGKPSNTRQIKKVAGENCYKIRYSLPERIAFKIYSQNGSLILLIGEILTHQDGNKLHKQEYSKFHNNDFKTMFKINDIISSDILNTPEIFQPIPSEHFIYSIGRIWTYEDEQRIRENIDAELIRALSNTQEEILNDCGPLLVRGSAGSGKTTIALYRLIKSSSKRKLYVTLTRSLKFYAQECFQKLTNNLESEKPDFMTIEELCLSVIRKENKFQPSKKMNYEYFRELNFIKKACTKYRISPFILWEEIRGVLKQSIIELDRRDYLDTAQDPHIAEAVFSVYQNYCEYLNAKEMWDDVDLAREALDEAITYYFQGTYEKTYEAIIVDEVQDLTEFHIRLICQLCEIPRGIFMVGDESQSIHPSKFDWLKVKNNIQDSFNDRGYISSPKICFLSENFRSTKPIFELSQKICKWRGKLFNLDHNYNYEICQKQYGEPIYLLEPPIFENQAWDILPYDFMVIISSEEYRDDAISKFGVGSVLTVYEAKGLENKNVILYRFFDDTQFKRGFTFLLKLIGISSQSKNVSTLLNILNVAVTRSEQCLYIVDYTRNLHNLEFIKTFSFTLDDGSKLISYLNSQRKNPEGYFAWAKKLELAGAYLQAEANYMKSHEMGHPVARVYAYKCSGMYKMLKHQYTDAKHDLEMALYINDDSILRELYECEGIIELENGNLTTATDKLQSANVSLGEIVQKILTSSKEDKYNYALKFILEQDTNYLEEFLSNPENIKHLDFSRKMLEDLNYSDEVIELCMKYLIAEIKRRLDFSMTTFNELYSHLNQEIENLEEEMEQKKTTNGKMNATI